MRDDTTIVVLEGDQTGQELLAEALRVLAADVIGVEIAFPRFDLSLANRRATQNQVVLDAAAAIREHGLGLKAATVTPEGRGDVGSPNRILREEIGGKVIVRTGRRIPGVVPLGGVYAPISIVRMAVGDAYGAKEWREGEGDEEVAFRTERIERSVCHAVAEFAFRQAARTGAKVFGGPKYTVSPTYEGMLKEEMDAAAARHPQVPYEPQLIDATFALLISSTGDPLVIPALNRDGDILSDLVLPLFGSIAGSESLLVAFEADFEPAAIMAEAAHGTAPSLEGKNVANPMAMILAGAALLSHGDEDARRAGRAVREAASRQLHCGARTSDLGGHLRNERVHRRGDRPNAREARGLGDLLGIPLQLLLELALAEVQGDPAADDEHDDPRRGIEPVALDRIGSGLAAVVRDEPHDCRPRDPAERVPEKKAPPLHPPETCDPRSGEAQDRDETAEEDHLAAVPAHDSLDAREHSVRPASASASARRAPGRPSAR